MCCSVLAPFSYLLFKLCNSATVVLTRCFKLLSFFYNNYHWNAKHNKVPDSTHDAMCNKLSFIIITKALKFWLQTEILSAHNRSSQITWVSLVRLQHHSIFSAWQTSFHRHQTLQAPDSIKPMVFYHPPCISIHSPPCWKHLETYSLCCWLVLLQVSPQPIPQAHPVFQKRVLLQPCNFSLRQPQTSLANSQQTPTPQTLLTATHHFSCHFTCRQLCFFSLS